MKKLILVFAAFAITVGAYAQIDSTYRRMNPQDMNKQNQRLQSNPIDKSHPDGVMMQNGKMMKVKNGKITFLDHIITMSNGTKVMSDGYYIHNDGTKLMMKEGQHMDMSGKMVFLKTNEDKSMYLVPDSARKTIYH